MQMDNKKFLKLLDKKPVKFKNEIKNILIKLSENVNVLKSNKSNFI